MPPFPMRRTVMNKTRLFGATLALGWWRRGTRSTRHGSEREHRHRVEPDSERTRPPCPRRSATPRFYAMTHIAMFDAINTIEREFEPYRVQLRPGRRSTEAAAAQAAHDVLVAINPSAASTYDAALAPATRNRSVGLRPPRRCGRRAGRQGDPGVAAERWLGGHAVSTLFRAAAARGAGSRPRRTTPPRRSRIFRTPCRWRW